MGEFRHVPDDELRAADVPGADADWDALNRFALTFHGYTYWGDFLACSDVAVRANRHDRETGELPEVLTELRTMLFCHASAVRNNMGPRDEDVAHARRLCEAIRRRLNRAPPANGPT